MPFRFGLGRADLDDLGWSSAWAGGRAPAQAKGLNWGHGTVTHCTSRQMTLTSACHKLFRWWLWPPQLFASWGSWHPTHPNSSFIRTNCLLLVCCTPPYHPLIWTLTAAANLQDCLVLDLNQTLLCSCSDWCLLQSFHQLNETKYKSAPTWQVWTRHTHARRNKH